MVFMLRAIRSLLCDTFFLKLKFVFRNIICGIEAHAQKHKILLRKKNLLTIFEKIEGGHFFLVLFCLKSGHPKRTSSMWSRLLLNWTVCTFIQIDYLIGKCWFVFLFVCLNVCLYFCVSVCLFVCITVWCGMSLCVCVFVDVTVCLCDCLPVWQSICVAVCISFIS